MERTSCPIHRWKSLVISLVLISVSAIPLTVLAEMELDYSIAVQNDVRLDVDRIYEIVPDDDNVGSKIVEADGTQFSRNEASVRFKVRGAPVPKIRFVGDIELIWLNLSERQLELGELTDRSAIDPWRLECDAAYVDLRDVVPGLDIRLGRQIVHWGAADLFNPTDNINPDDIEDRVVFREAIANEMIRIDYTYLPEREGWLGDVTFTFVWVPVFRPSQLPRSATIPMVDTNEEIPVLEDDIREQIENLRTNSPIPLDDPVVRAELPRFSFENSQIGVRVQARMENTDFSLSYYRGYDDFPVMRRADASFSSDATAIESNTTLVYPRMQVFGFDINGQLPFLDDLGFWVEGAVFFPERVGLTFAFPPELGVAYSGTSVDDRPFFKLTVGFDYSFNQYVFMNVQYVRGMMNNFGATNINNFLVAGLDLKFWSDRILIRLFGLLQLDWLGEGFRGQPFDEWKDQISAMLVPMFLLNPWGSLELDFGAIVPVGSRGSYFGQPATGATTLFLRARASF